MIRAALVLLLLAGCAERQPEPALVAVASCDIPLVTASTHDLMTPATLASIRRTNAAIRRCRSHP